MCSVGLWDDKFLNAARVYDLGLLTGFNGFRCLNDGAWGHGRFYSSTTRAFSISFSICDCEAMVKIVGEGGGGDNDNDRLSEISRDFERLRRF
ncbi:hypothetical protein DY000_02002673 [Brassica cretica]|uniref:AP2/ERF domain-containing protein n=1 Tax=Brassica cretica TaxID=69181 RepID=A0ABQ7C7C9_BRACR|nr:hypothetical protein DY000_02002673 [Brassica cretica]